MPRDLDLFRKLILALDREPGDRVLGIEFKPYTREQLLYHLELIRDGGFGGRSRPIKGFAPLVGMGLTFKGAEFADAAREDRIWSKVMAFVKDRVGTAPLAIVQELLERAHRDAFSVLDRQE